MTRQRLPIQRRHCIDKLITATNGLGLVEEVEYAAMGDTRVDKPVAVDVNGAAITRTYPVKQVSITHKLVKTVSRSNG